MDHTTQDAQWADHYWMSEDGLKLHYRDYAGDDDAPPILCLHGLTRTCRDYEVLAPFLSGQDVNPVIGDEAFAAKPKHQYRVIAPDLRGHGASEYAREPSSYGLEYLLSDIALLFAELGISEVIMIGTSLGGILTAHLASAANDQAGRIGGDQERRDQEEAGSLPQILGAVINDIGPELELAGLLRIGENAGQVRSYPTWMHAARALMESHRLSFPDYDLQRWITLAKRNMIVGQNGRIMLDYDLDVAEPLTNITDGESAPPDMWDAFSALDMGPLAIIRGELSDLFAKPTYEAMLKRISGAQGAEVAREGHTPALDEPVALSAILSLLERAQQR